MFLSLARGAPPWCGRGRRIRQEGFDLRRARHILGVSSGEADILDSVGAYTPRVPMGAAGQSTRFGGRRRQRLGDAHIAAVGKPLHSGGCCQAGGQENQAKNRCSETPWERTTSRRCGPRSAAWRRLPTPPALRGHHAAHRHLVHPLPARASTPTRGAVHWTPMWRCPTSMRPLEAGCSNTGFMFSFDAGYQYGDGIASIGTYTPASAVTDNGDYSNAPWFRFNRALPRRLPGAVVPHGEIDALRVRHRSEHERLVPFRRGKRGGRLRRVPGVHRLARCRGHVHKHRRQAPRRRGQSAAS